MRSADKDENINCRNASLKTMIGQFVNTRREFLILETPCFPVIEKINLKKFKEFMHDKIHF